jgi:hypothetical protein
MEGKVLTPFQTEEDRMGVAGSLTPTNNGAVIPLSTISTSCSGRESCIFQGAAGSVVKK